MYSSKQLQQVKKKYLILTLSFAQRYTFSQVYKSQLFRTSI